MTQPMSQRPRLIFTDLDGSLLDHYSYDWSPAVPWLKRLKQAGVPVIPVTSKTRAELMSLRLDLGLADSPFIAENGAVIGLPASWQHARLDRDPRNLDGLCVKTPSVDNDFLWRRLEVLRERLKLYYRCMREMTVEEVMRATGLDEPQARQSRIREGSEPLLWDDSDEALEVFRRALHNDGLTLTRGGHFWHVMGDVDKGRSLRWLMARFEALRGEMPATLGLGDGPDDTSMLETVDQAVLIRGEHRQPVSIVNPHLYCTRSPGPAGWAEGLDYWLGERFFAPSSQEGEPA
ncbi:HAD-IIB family hydrolase [Halomonas sp. HP20-15]|uniref:HAD-IIB family hydrolase n=1 Tax=Halomonas sp. HP20-15 TaxID=3085901 RepID=UPI00298122C6|nr:HAD-IIB family hydrolase [Halomonas sp. HP20-15]MDW5377351.1 HAD-IIB family hydrolase [Halomonas sp. HP20-15]